MSRVLDLSDFEYKGIDPHSGKPGTFELGREGVRFILPRKKKRKTYTAHFDLKWDEVISFEACEVSYGEDDNSWPLEEEMQGKFESVGSAGMFFLFLMPMGQASFQIWGYMPIEDVPLVRDLAKKYLNRPSLPGLAHHGTASAVRYVLKHCEVLSTITGEWHDWAKKGPSLSPVEKLLEKGPDYVFCKEGMAIDHYGAGEQLEQMSTFWPWRLVQDVFLDQYEVLYRWHEDAYIYRQQVWEDDERRSFYEAARSALDYYKSSDDVDEMLLIRPWSFPSRSHKTWEKLEPFSSKASRAGFPPVYDFDEVD
ncbi:MAG: hypothetical protein ACW99U_01760 [Candidatus Thorarchaeota archaeon]